MYVCTKYLYNKKKKIKQTNDSQLKKDTQKRRKK